MTEWLMPILAMLCIAFVIVILGAHLKEARAKREAEKRSSEGDGE